MTTIESLLAQPLVARVGWGLLHSVWQIAGVAILVAMALGILRRSSAQARYLTACAGLLLMILLPGMTLAFVEVAGVHPPERGAVSGKPATVDVLPQRREPDGDEPQALREVNRETSGRLPEGAPMPTFADLVAPRLSWLVAAWAFGVLGLSVRLVGAWILLRRLVRRGTRPVEGHLAEAFGRLRLRLRVSRPVRLLESSLARVPMVVGWLRPVVLLPASALTGLTPNQLEAILAHELAHVRRHDYLVNLMQNVIETLLFYHPAVWWLARRIRLEREHCCDDWAVSICDDRLAYARALAAMEELRGTSWSLAPSAAGKPLLARIRRLVGVAPPASRPAGGLAGMVALAAVVGLGLVLVVAPGANPARADVETKPPITGTVVTPEGEPVAGADLWLVGMAVRESRALVLATARTDASGRFRLERRGEGDGAQGRGAIAVWAHKTGTRPAHSLLKYDTTTPEPTLPIRLTLALPAEFSIRVLDPDGNPVAGAKAAVCYLRDDRTHPPEDLIERLEAVTDAEGRAVLSTAPPETVEMLRVTSGQYGTQVSHHRKGLKDENDLRLRPVARVEGRVQGVEPAAARGLKVHISSYPKDRTKGEVYGRADVTTDDNGRFTIPALASGMLDLSIRMPEGSTYRPLRPSDGDFEGARRIDLEIALKRVVRVRGVLLEKGTTRPVGGVGIRFFNRENCDSTPLPLSRTDAGGRFEALALPGPDAFMYVDVPNAFLKQLRSPRIQVTDADGQTLPPIEVERGATIRGRVVDEGGKPVSGATVEGKWTGTVPGSGSNGMMLGYHGNATAASDSNGEFLLVGIPRDASVSLEVEAGDARTERPSQATAGAGPVMLRVSGSNTVALSGRVVDTSGNPIVGALVRVRARPPAKDSYPDTETVRFAGAAEVRTGPDGRFQTPHQLRRSYAYRAEVQAEGMMSESTPWLPLGPTTEPILPELAMRRLRPVGGRVLDTRGRPVAGVVVKVTGDAPVSVRSVTDAQGRFRLSGVLEGPAFIFAEKAGFRFQGRRTLAGASAASVTIVREDEPPLEPLTTRPPAQTRAEELALLHRILAPYADRVFEAGDQEERFSILRILAEVERGRVIERLKQQEGLVDKRRRDWFSVDLANRLAEDDVDKALALIEVIRDPSARSFALLNVVAKIPDSGRARKLDVLAKALASAGAVEVPGDRSERLAQAGERLLDLGETGRASRLLREAGALAHTLPKVGFAAYQRGNVAEELAQVDLPAALALLEGTEGERDSDVHFGHIAHELARRSPAEAERVLLKMRDVWPNFRDTYTQRVCSRMATVDRARAKRLADAMKDYRLKARALGAMALALAPTDKPASLRLLAEAFGTLERIMDDDQDYWNGLGSASTAAAGLLPMIERIDPNLLPEYLWRTLALRPPLRVSDARVGVSDISNARVAAVAARYDAEKARLVLESFADRAFARVPFANDFDKSFEAESLFTAMAVVNPARAVAMVESLPDGPDLPARSLKDSARLTVARILAAEGEQRWRIIERLFLHVWRIDSEDD